MNSDNNPVIWQGTPSHYSNLDSNIFWSVFCILAVVILDLTGLFHYVTLPYNLGNTLAITQLQPILISLLTQLLLIFPIWKLLSNFLTIHNTNYQLTDERLITSTGILNRSHDEVELYRIKDYQIDEPFFQRLFSLGTVILETSDKSHPHLSLSAIKDPKKIRDAIRGRVETLRTQKGVREIDH